MPSALPISLSGPSRGWPTWLLAALTAVWLALAGNIALWQTLWNLPEVTGWRGVGFVAGFAVLVCGLLGALLSLMAWPRVLKPFAIFLLLSAAGATHFMLRYHIVIDSSMLLNVVHTDTREAADLMSPMLFITLGVIGLLPGWWLATRPLAPASVWQRLWRNLVATVVWLLLAAAAVMLIFQDFASVMRNHKSVRYLINPLNSLYAVLDMGVQTAPHASQPLQPIGEDARLGPSYVGQQRPPLLVLVVGETARAPNFGLGGYARDTTPALRALAEQGDLVWYGNAWSCGTNTQASVPCMFSHHGKQGHEARKGRFENLLDVLSRAGLAVLWLDNQSGCKGVCDRVANVSTTDMTDAELCDKGECLDGVMLRRLPQEWAKLPAEQRARGTVVVMHQMGSHGPAYFRRSPPALKAFQPECTETALQACDRQAVVNAYDNSLRYTDRFLADTIAWLKTQQADASLIYVSDHGESLGENNLYLHGLPYALAPDEQKHVPWVNWLSAGMRHRLGLDMACLKSRASQTITHDNLFHSVLGLMDVQTQVRQEGLDLYQACKGGA